MKKKLLMFLFIIIAISIIGCGEKEVEIEKVDNSITNETVGENTNEEISAKLLADNNTNYGISKDTSFVFEVKNQPITKEYLAKNLVFNEDISFDVEAIERNEFKIIPKNPLKNNTIVKAVYKDMDKNEYEWAFQVEKQFNVQSSIPRDMATEVPINAGIEIEFSKGELGNIEENFKIEPKTEGKFEVNENRVVFIPNSLKANTTYTITIDKSFSRLKQTEKLNKDFSIKFKTSNKEAGKRAFELSFDKRLYHILSDQNPFISIRSNYKNFSKGSKINVSLFEYNDTKTFIESMKKFDEESIDYWDERFTSQKRINTEEMAKIIEFDTDIIENERDYYYGDYVVFPDKLKEGMYLVEIKKDEKIFQTHLEINSASYYTSLANNGIFAWGNDLKTKKPIKNAELNIYEENINEKCDKDGIFFAEMDNSKYDNSAKYIYFKSDSKIDYVSVLEPNYMSFYYYNGSNNEASKYWSYLSTDRALYLKEDKINVFGVLKNRDNKEIKEKVYLKVGKYYSHGEEDFIITKEISINKYNAFETSINLESFNSGYYNIYLVVGENVVEQENIEVRQFEKPMYDIKISTDKKFLFEDESLNMNISCNYYEGRGVSNLNMQYAYYYGDNNFSNKFKLNKNGKAEVFIDEIGKNDNNTFRPRYVDIQVFSDDIENTSADNYENIFVFPRNRMITSKIIESDEKINEIELQIETNEIDISKLSDSNIRYWIEEDDYRGEKTNQEVDIAVEKYKWTKTEVGTIYDPIQKITTPKYEYDEVLVGVDNIKAQTINGIANVKLELEDEHYYKIICKTKDTKDRVVEISQYYHYGIRRYNEQDYYEFEWDKDYDLKVNEKRKYYVLKNDKKMQLEENQRIIYLELQNGIKHYMVSDEALYDFNFKEEDIPNVFIQCVIFDGYEYKSVYPTNIRYDYSDEEINVVLKTDKEKYKPGENVEIEIFAKDLFGKPVEGYVNISIVDEALFAIAPKENHLLEDLYKSVFSTGVMAEDFGLESSDKGMAAEGGGEGGNDFIRSEFENTAYFGNVITNKDGYAKCKVKLPDNITAWRISTQIITKDLKGNSIKTIKRVGLPYFIEVISEDNYLEGDKPSITVKSVNNIEDKNTNVDYTFKLLKDKKEVVNLSKTINVEDYVNFDLPKLEKGEYEISVTGKYGNNKDGILKKFEVVDSMLKVDQIIKTKLDENTKLQNNGMQTLKFMNENSSIAYRIISSYLNEYGDRVEQKVSQNIANDWLEYYYNESRRNENIDISLYQLYSGGICVVKHGDEDIEVSSKLSVLDENQFDLKNLEIYLSQAKKEELTDDAIAAILWAQAVKGKPVLLDMKNLLENTSSDKAKLYLGLGLKSIGDKSSAIEVYDEFRRSKTNNIGNLKYINADLSDDKSKKSILMAILGVMLEKEDALDYYDYADRNTPKEDLISIEMLLLAKELLNRNEQAYFEYSVGDEFEKIELNNYKPFVTTILENQVSKFKVRNVQNVVMIEESQVNLSDLAVDDKIIEIERRYYNESNQEVKTFKQGEIIRVVLEPKFKKDAELGNYVVIDRIPFGCEFSYKRDNSKYSYQNDKRTRVFYFNYGDEVNKTITYYFKAISPGEYRCEPAVIQKKYIQLFGKSNETNIVIEE